MYLAPTPLRCLLVLALTAAPSVAMAQLDARATAARRALIEDAQRARVAGDHAQALALAQRALQIQASATLRRFVAEELLQNRRFADAAGMAELCETDLRAEPPSRARAEHLAACQTVRRDASAHTARLLVRFEPALPTDGAVTVNDEPLPSALWGVPAVVDEGSAVIEVRHPRFQVVQRQVTIGVGTTVEVAITLTPVTAQTTSTTAATQHTDTTPRHETRATPPPRRAEDVRPRPPQVVTSISPLLPIGAVVGGVGLAASVGLYAGALTVAADFDRACFANGVASPGEICGARFQSDQNTIDALQWGAVGGIGLLAAGTTLAIVGALTPSRRVVVAATAREIIVGGSF